jgi:hypothetical protein
MHAYPLPAKEGMEDGGFEIEICLAERPPTNAFRFAIEGTEDLDFFYQPELTAEESAEGAVRTENVIGSYAANCKTKANHRVADTIYGRVDGWFWHKVDVSVRLPPCPFLVVKQTSVTVVADLAHHRWPRAGERA